MLSFQNNFNVISLGRGDFKLSFGDLNNEFRYTVKESLNILQSALCYQSEDFIMAVKQCKEL